MKRVKIERRDHLDGKDCQICGRRKATIDFKATCYDTKLVIPVIISSCDRGWCMACAEKDARERSSKMAQQFSPNEDEITLTG